MLKIENFASSARNINSSMLGCSIFWWFKIAAAAAASSKAYKRFACLLDKFERIGGIITLSSVIVGAGGRSPPDLVFIPGIIQLIVVEKWWKLVKIRYKKSELQYPNNVIMAVTAVSIKKGGDRWWSMVYITK